MNKFRKNDMVVVTKGSDLGRQGQIEKVIKDAKGRVVKALVTGVNISVKHIKPDPRIDRKGGKEQKAMPVSIANLAHFNPQSNKAEKIRIVRDNLEKKRVYRSNGKQLSGSLAKKA